MISFKDIELQDKEVISTYTLPCPQRNCDLSFSNLCSWRFLYGTRFAVFGGFLLMKFRAGGRLTYMMPIGQGDLRAAVEALMEDARAEGEPFRLSGICPEMCGELEVAMPGRFRFTSNRDYADYLYLRQDLATLAGRSLQAKRNHVNRFRRTYPYEYLPLTPDHVAECLELEAAWYERRDTRNEIQDTRNEGTSAEREALTYALRHFREIGLTGGILQVEGHTVAFTFGMPINRDTFGVHVEKADTGIREAYAMINYEFARHVPPQYVYLNREEDLGIEGLRRAKLSYQPAMILEKFVAEPIG